MWQETTLVRWGLILGFFAFVFATPELVGEQRLQRADTFLRHILRSLNERIDSVTRDEINRGMLSSGLRTVAIWGAIIAAYVFAGHGDLLNFFREPPPSFLGPFISKAVVLMGAAIMLFVATIVAFLLAVFILAPLVGFLVSLFANEAAWRRRSLVLGAALFAAGQILQFLGTYAPSRK